MIKLTLQEAGVALGTAVSIPDDPKDALIQLAVAMPPMVRWTTALLQSTSDAHTGIRELIDERRDDLYVPLTSDPKRAILTLRAETELLSVLGVAREIGDPLVPLGFYRRERDPRAFIATGLSSEELGVVAVDGGLRKAADVLAAPRGLVPVAVALGDKGLSAYAVDTGRKVDI